VNSRLLARGSVYAAVYAAVTLAPGLSGLAYGQVQFRLSEGLTVFACVDPAAVPGLTVGTALANLGSPLGLTDVIVGSLLTLLAVSIMWGLGLRPWALVAPVVVNGLGVGAELRLVQHLSFWASVGFVALGEAVVMTTAGLIIFGLVRRYGGVLGLARQRRDV
jgi:uncharacterized membrane protein